MSAKTYKIAAFPIGMSNRREDYALAGDKDHPQVLRDAINVDVSSQGKLRRRDGFARVLSGSFLHSLWAPPSGKFALYVDGSRIVRMEKDGSIAVVATGIVPHERMSFADVNGAVFYSNGINHGSLFDSGPAWGSTPVPWGDRTLDAMPAGQHICYGTNRLYVASGDTIYYSVPFAPHLTDAASNFIQLPARVVLLAAVPGGLFIGADKTYFAAGGLPGESLNVAATAVPVEWSESYDPVVESAAWLSTDGITIGYADGTVKVPQRAEIAVSRAKTGASTHRIHNGVTQVIGSLIDPTQTAATVGTFMQAHLVRKGIAS